MSKKCSKCEKTVYPTEELKCLDKIWHKACFKCEVCGMTLNMKNYKGYDKMPYCSAHYPQTKHTQVADTPEGRRIAENTKIQSQVQYHADFEKLKGHKTSVAEDPETARIKQNTAIQSNINYWGVREQRNMMEEKRPMEAVDNGMRPHGGGPERRSQGHDSYTESSRHSQPQRRHNEGTMFSYTAQQPPADRRSYGQDPSRGYAAETEQRAYTYAQEPDARSHGQDAPGTYPDGRRSYTDDRRSGDLSNPGRRQPGSISDYDPMNEKFGSVASDSRGYQPHPEPVRQPQPVFQPPPPQSAPPKSKGMVCKAMYDYQAADADEVSFMDGDLIIECQSVDAGWMTGRVERTGQYGMLPSNYVERIN